MRRFYSFVGAADAVIWAAAVVLRETAAMEFYLPRLLLGVAPNFGAVFMGVGLGIYWLPHLLKRELSAKAVAVLALLSLAILLVSEIIHDRFLGAPLDPWDIAASLLAALLLFPLHLCWQQATRKK